MRAVLDTNILISALIARRQGPARFVYHKALERAFALVTSPALLHELAEKLRKKFGVAEPDIQITVRALSKVSRRQNALVQPGIIRHRHLERLQRRHHPGASRAQGPLALLPRYQSPPLK